MLEKIEGLNKL